jgi:hypothetical protein
MLAHHLLTTYQVMEELIALRLTLPDGDNHNDQIISHANRLKRDVLLAGMFDKDKGPFD